MNHGLDSITIIAMPAPSPENSIHRQTIPGNHKRLKPIKTFIGIRNTLPFPGT